MDIVENYLSLGGFNFFSALESIDKMLMQTDATVKAALHSCNKALSSYKIDKHMNPFE